MPLFNSIFPGLEMQSPDFKEQVYPLGEVEAPDIILKGKENQQVWGRPGPWNPGRLTQIPRLWLAPYFAIVSSGSSEFRLRSDLLLPAYLGRASSGILHHSPLYGHTVPCRVSTLRLVAHSCLTLRGPADCSPPGSSVHGILQETALEWVAMPSFGGTSQPRIKPRSPALQADSLPSEPPANLKKMQSFYSILVDPVSLHTVVPLCA